MKAREHPGGPRRRTRPLRRHCRPCAPRPHPAAGVRGFRGGVYWSKPWTGNDFHVSTRQEAGMVRAEKATAVADIAERFKAATAALITEYRG
ncbi:hypothetical protein I552_6650 [Mycobacterium xenopi 3993]|nr:hypothetical protein I552_6650 [Mycobacterium xenopi 3993]